MTGGPAGIGAAVGGGTARSAADPGAVAVRLTRRIAAPPAEVYRAWLEPAILRRWFAPDGLWVSRAEVDARVGGRFRIWQDDSSGLVGGSECELLELVPDARIVLRWQFVGPDRVPEPAHESRLTVTLEPAPGGATDLTLVHERLDALVADLPEMLDGTRRGWGDALDGLGTAIAGRVAARRLDSGTPKMAPRPDDDPTSR